MLSKKSLNCILIIIYFRNKNTFSPAYLKRNCLFHPKPNLCKQITHTRKDVFNFSHHYRTFEKYFHVTRGCVHTRKTWQQLFARLCAASYTARICITHNTQPFFLTALILRATYMQSAGASDLTQLRSVVQWRA